MIDGGDLGPFGDIILAILYFNIVFLVIGIGAVIVSFIIGIKRIAGKLFLVAGIICCIPYLYLLKQDIQSNIDKWNNLSPLFRAIEKKKYDKVKQLISEGCDINEDNIYINPPTPLTYAIDKGNIRIVKLLVENGANVNFISSINPTLNLPLSQAIFKGDTAIVNYLLQHGADVSAKKDFFPIEFAINCNNKDVVESLIKYGADVNTNQGKPLYAAVSDYKYEITKCLLEHGATAHDNNMQGMINIAKYVGAERDIDSLQQAKMLELLNKYTPK